MESVGQRGSISIAAALIACASGHAQTLVPWQPGEIRLHPQILCGEQADLGVGSTLAAGDFDGDGIDDLAVSAWAEGVEGIRDGEAAIFLGKSQLGGGVGPKSIGQAALRILGRSTFFGYSLALGDLNGDRKADLAVGAYRSRPAGRINAGAAYVFLGRALDPDHPLVIDLNEDEADLAVWGAAWGDELGRSVAIGDADGDGLGDLLAGARLARGPNTWGGGAVYLIWGDRQFPVTPVVDLASTSPDLTFYGPPPVEWPVHVPWFGQSVQLADVDGDGAADLFIGAPGHSREHPFLPSGAVFGWRGGQWLRERAAIDLSRDQSHLELDTERPLAEFGWALALGNLDGDRWLDLAVGAPTGEQAGPNTPELEDQGIIFIVHGQADLLNRGHVTLEQGGLAYSSFTGESALEQAGVAMATGDLTGDAIGDLLIGAFAAGSAPLLAHGTSYVRAGHPLPGTPARGRAPGSTWWDLRIDGTEPGLFAGRGVAAGDFDGDGFDDAAVGEPGAALAENKEAGRVQVYYTGPSRLAARLRRELLARDWPAALTIEAAAVDHAGRYLAYAAGVGLLRFRAAPTPGEPELLIPQDALAQLRPEWGEFTCTRVVPHPDADRIGLVLISTGAGAGSDSTLVLREGGAVPELRVATAPAGAPSAAWLDLAWLRDDLTEAPYAALAAAGVDWLVADSAAVWTADVDRTELALAPWQSWGPALAATPCALPAANGGGTLRARVGLALAQLQLAWWTSLPPAEPNPWAAVTLLPQGAPECRCIDDASWWRVAQPSIALGSLAMRRWQQEWNPIGQHWLVLAPTETDGESLYHVGWDEGVARGARVLGGHELRARLGLDAESRQKPLSLMPVIAPDGRELLLVHLIGHAEAAGDLLAVELPVRPVITHFALDAEGEDVLLAGWVPERIGAVLEQAHWLADESELDPPVDPWWPLQDWPANGFYRWVEYDLGLPSLGSFFALPGTAP